MANDKRKGILGALQFLSQRKKCNSSTFEPKEKDALALIHVPAKPPLESALMENGAHLFTDDQIPPEDLACSILEVKYIKGMGREISIDPRVNRDLYPFGWFTSGTPKIKARILTEAIEKKCLIVETSSYLEFQEGIEDIHF